ncbi:sensor histidine kinase [Frisingicoccus sp.]|uniref:sensor histidine kinase n=1 Tax=Frisingicoccus sp. TaxID=1918627 RepID=UPI003AB33529
MAIKWKKSKMYGPKKPGIIRRGWWFWKEKLCSMTGLYVISVILLMAFLMNIVDSLGMTYGYLVFNLYIAGLLNVALWIYLFRRIRKDTSTPFFMNWMKNMDCDVLILLYCGLFIGAFFFLSVAYYNLYVPIYDWDGEYLGSYLNQTEFSLILLPMAAVHNALFMIIIRHLKNPVLRRATFCRRMYGRAKSWVQAKKKRYQEKYPFEKKVQMETFLMSAIAVGIGVLSLLCVGAWGFSRLFIAFVVFIAALIIFGWMRYHRAFLTDVGTLVEEIHEVSTGNPLESSAIPEDSMIYEAGEDLTHVFENLSDSVKRQVQSEKMKMDLITNVSHDLKTPLTSIIGYVDLLKKTELSDEARDYVEILSQKSERLKKMIQDVFEISKATSGNMEIHPETVDICMLMRQTLGDMEDRIGASKRTIRKTLSAEPLYVVSDGQKLYRVYQNLIENALKYSLEGSRIFIDAFGDDRTVTTIIKNTSSYEMNFDEETITERFARGDVNRTTEGHGLGLAIVKSFVEACGGKFHIDIDGDLFKAVVTFPRHIPDEAEEKTEELPELPAMIEASLNENT